MASVAPTGERMTLSPCRDIVTSRRTAPTPSSVRAVGRVFALTKAKAKSATPMPTNTSRLVIAQAGIFAVSTT